jgi:diguanylate cyclase (GGDEF)-like protein
MLMQDRRMRSSDSISPPARRKVLRLYPSSAPLPLLVYRDFIDMLYSMWVPIAGLGLAFVAVCLLIGAGINNDWLLGLAALGTVTTLARLAVLRAYVRSPPKDLVGIRIWERRYAVGNYISAVLLALLNVIVISYHDPLLHLIAVSLVFGFGAGVVSRISIRPRICVISLLLATVPTVGALAAHAFTAHSNTLHTELFAIEALIVAMITGLSLQTVSHLFCSAVEHHTARHDMAQLARYDALTGLANRLSLREQFGTRMDVALRAGNCLAVHFLDLDGFKPVNDRYGHPAGDALLVEVARRLEAMVRDGDIVARLGGDEFVVIQTDIRDDSEAEMLARRIIRQIATPFEFGELVMTVSVSVGIAAAPAMGVELEALLRCADAALYRAKSGGRARLHFCADADRTAASCAA